jgi:hypothetical protein
MAANSYLTREAGFFVKRGFGADDLTRRVSGPMRVTWYLPASRNS